MSTTKLRNDTKQYLKNNNLTQQDLANKLGISKQYLYQFLTGRRDSITIELQLRDIIYND